MNTELKNVIIRIIEFILSLFSSNEQVEKRRKVVDKTHKGIKSYLKKYKK